MIAVRIEVTVGDKVIADNWHCADATAKTYIPGPARLITHILRDMARKLLPAVERACNERYEDDTPKLSD